MDWNVIADEEGKCPKCGMLLEKVTVDEAVKNLKDNGYSVK
jgi:transcription initiation factor IIE alpha subunit